MKKQRHKTPPAERREWVRKFVQDNPDKLSGAQFVQANGLKQTSFFLWLAKYGHEFGYTSPVPIAPRTAKGMDLLLAGKTPAEVAKRLGVGVQRVHNWSSRYMERWQAEGGGDPPPEVKPAAPAESRGAESRGAETLDDDWTRQIEAEQPLAEPEDEEDEAYERAPEVPVYPRTQRTQRPERQRSLPFQPPPPQQTIVSPRELFQARPSREPQAALAVRSGTLRDQVMGSESEEVLYLRRALERALRERDAALLMYELRVREDGH